MWYSFQDTTSAARRASTGTTRRSRSPCPNLFPELGTGGVGPHGAATYEYDPDNPSTTKFPPYYDDAVFFGEFTRDTLKEIRLDEQNKIFKINNLLNCGALRAARSQPFECDNPMDLQFGADGAFYLLTYGDGFFAANPDAGMYKWEYVKGQRAPQAVLTASVTNGAGAAGGAVLQRRLARPGPAGLAHVRVGLRRERDGRLDRSERRARVHAERRLRGEADRHRLERARRTSRRRRSPSGTRRRPSRSPRRSTATSSTGATTSPTRSTVHRSRGPGDRLLPRRR